MARPKKNTIDYFPHFVIHGKKMFMIEKKYGSKGYAFWFKLLEQLGKTENHFLSLNSIPEMEYLSALTGVSATETTEIMTFLADIDAIDRELWGTRIVWCQNFVDNLSEVYRKRKRELPSKPITATEMPISATEIQALSGVSATENTQSRVKDSKLKEIKETHSDSKGEAEPGSQKVVSVFDPFLIHQQFKGKWAKVTHLQNGMTKAGEWFKDNCSDESIDPEKIWIALDNYKLHYLSQKETGLKPLNACNFLKQHWDWINYEHKEEKDSKAQTKGEINDDRFASYYDEKFGSENSDTNVLGDVQTISDLIPSQV